VYSPLSAFIVCPACKATAREGFDLSSEQCHRCKNRFFSINGALCCFPSGIAQKELWRHLLASATEESSATLEQLQQQLRLPSLSSSTRRRMKLFMEFAVRRATEIFDLVKGAGITPKKQDKFESYSARSLFDYHDLILRDWGWQPVDGVSDNYRVYSDENKLSLETVKKALQKLIGKSRTENKEAAKRPRRILVIGSGAGRLSWEVHCLIEPEATVALDFNPVLSLSAYYLIRKRATISSVEIRRFPRSGLPAIHHWHLKCPEQAQRLHETWYPMIADAWSMPFADHSFDLVITPWFLDINGRDVKDLIPLVEKSLVPGGYWLNYGPFLYRQEAPEHQKYTSTEILEFLALSRFELLYQAFDTQPYIHSPLSERGRLEESWCFLAQASVNKPHLADAGEFTESPITPEQAPPWLVMKHLPVPRFNPSRFPPELGSITQLIDGKRSVNDIVDILARQLPAEFNPHEIINTLFSEYIIGKEGKPGD
jgi:hypothetical protein